MFSVGLKSLLSLIAYLKQLVWGGAGGLVYPMGCVHLKGLGRVIRGLLEHSDPREDLGGHVGLKHMILLNCPSAPLRWC